MEKGERELIAQFYNIRNQGWIKTHRHGDQMLGNTFEDLIGKVEDNLSEADWKGIEIKTHRNATSSMVSLFSKSPSHPKGANSYLREKYGVVDPSHGLKVLNTTIRGDYANTHRGGHSFKLEVDRFNEKIYLIVRDTYTNNVIDNNIYWDFSVIKNALDKKIRKIAVMYGDEMIKDYSNYVKFTDMVLIEGLTLDKMIEALENGDLKLDIRIGVYNSGKKYGKTHDHGSAFRINLNKLLDYGKRLNVGDILKTIKDFKLI